MKYQVLFSLKNNDKIFQMSSAAVVNGALRVNFKLFQMDWETVILSALYLYINIYLMPMLLAEWAF